MGVITWQCVYISFPFFISDKNKHEVSDQTYNCPHISYEPGVIFVVLNTFVEITFALSLHLGLLPEQ